MDISGPAAGDELMLTAYSSAGSKTRGTLNNCANGVTPWGTYLTCEENLAGYFKRPASSTLSAKAAAAQNRYMGSGSSNGSYGWANPAGGDRPAAFDGVGPVEFPVAQIVEDVNAAGGEREEGGGGQDDEKGGGRHLLVFIAQREKIGGQHDAVFDPLPRAQRLDIILGHDIRKAGTDKGLGFSDGVDCFGQFFEGAVFQKVP